jgi:hypothetical protein
MLMPNQPHVMLVFFVLLDIFQICISHKIMSLKSEIKYFFGFMVLLGHYFVECSVN